MTLVVRAYELGSNSKANAEWVTPAAKTLLECSNEVARMWDLENALTRRIKFLEKEMENCVVGFAERDAEIGLLRKRLSQEQVDLRMSQHWHEGYRAAGLSFHVIIFNLLQCIAVLQQAGLPTPPPQVKAHTHDDGETHEH